MYMMKSHDYYLEPNPNKTATDQDFAGHASNETGVQFTTVQPLRQYLPTQSIWTLPKQMLPVKSPFCKLTPKLPRGPPSPRISVS